MEVTKADLARMGVTEKGTQTYVLDRLQALEIQGKCYFIRNNSFAGRVTRYDGSQGFVRNNKPGTPDIIACFQYEYDGGDGPYSKSLTGCMFVGIEIKGPRGRLSPEQKLAHEAIERVGGEVWVIYSPEDFEAHLTRIALR